MEQCRADALRPGDLVDIEFDLKANPEGALIWREMYARVRYQAQSMSAPDTDVHVMFYNSPSVLWPKGHLVAMVRPSVQEHSAFLERYDRQVPGMPSPQASKDGAGAQLEGALAPARAFVF